MLADGFLDNLRLFFLCCWVCLIFSARLLPFLSFNFVGSVVGERNLLGVTVRD